MEWIIGAAEVGTALRKRRDKMKNQKPPKPPKKQKPPKNKRRR